MKEIVREIAKTVRKGCVKFAMSKKSKGYDFHYSPCLRCMCSIASCALKEQLSKKGIVSKVVLGEYGIEGDSHCWVEVGKYLVDITATQFDRLEEVVILSKNHRLWRKKQVASDYGFFVKDWGVQQRPNPTVIKEILKFCA